MSNQIYILAGANGSGKSTISRELLPAEGIVYINPDDIARELNPISIEDAKISAGKETLVRTMHLLDERRSFAIESTLSGNAYVRVIEKAKSLGYRINIIYTYVDSPEVCIARIAGRVQKGGHNIPEEDVRRRYVRSLNNFNAIYAPLADYWLLVYNGDRGARFVADCERDLGVNIFDQDEYRRFKEVLCRK